MTSRNSRLVAAAVLVALAAAHPAGAQQEPPIQSAAAAVSPAPWIDRVYDRVTRFFNQRVRAVDSYFAQHEPLEPERESQLRVRLFVDSDRHRTELYPRISADLQMPTLERRLDLYVQNVTRNVLPGSDPAKEEESLQIGARGDLFRGGRWAITRDLGVGFSHGLTLFAEVAGHYRWYWGQWEGVATQTVFWNRDDDFGGLSRLVLDRKLAAAVYLRLQSAARYTQDNGYWRTSQVAKVGWVIDEHTRYLIGSIAVLGKSRLVDEYRSELTYRARVYRPWIFVELTPYLTFPRQHGFESTPGVRVGLDLFFGGVPRL